MPRMRYPRSGTNPRAGCERQARRRGDLLERKRVEFPRDLALEPSLVALARMFARPAAIVALVFGVVSPPPRLVRFYATTLSGLSPRKSRPPGRATCRPVTAAR